MTARPVYLDFHATTPVDPRVLEAMLPYFTEHFGNPASRQHAYGWDAQKATEAARQQVAALIGASAQEIIFTSGATESNNLAIKGVAHALRDRGDHIITVATEHKSVLDSCKRLEREGCRVTRLGVDAQGFIDLDELKAAITDRTVLVSVMAANNEIGVLQPLGEIGAITQERGVLLHTDAAQAAGKIPLDVTQLGVDLLVAHRPQVLRAEGRRRSLRPPPQAETRALVPDRWRRPREWPPLGNTERPRHRRTRPRRGNLPRVHARRADTPRRDARSTLRRASA